jgi:transcriptional regulator of NAD metabolism
MEQAESLADKQKRRTERYQEMRNSMEAEMQLNREAAEKTIIEIKSALQVADDETKKQALTRLLKSVERSLERLQ